MRRATRLLWGLLATPLLLAAAPSVAAGVAVGPRPAAGWGVDGVVRAVQVVGDATYVGGTFSTVTGPDGGSRRRVNLAAFDTRTGAPLEGFGADTDGTVHTLVSDGDTLWVGGTFSAIGGVGRSRLAAVDARTGAVRSLRADVTGDVYALDLGARRLFVGGSFLSIAGRSRTRAAALDPATGTLDAHWQPAPDGTVLALEADAGGGVVHLGGQFRRAGGAGRGHLAAVDGVTGLATATVFENVPAPVLSIDADGSRVFGGVSGTPGVGNTVSAWDRSTGRRAWHRSADGDVQAVAHHRGNVYFGFHEGFGGDGSVRLLAAAATDGAIHPTFRPSFDRFWGVFAVDATDEAVVAGGDFTRVHGVAASGVVRFTAAPPPGDVFTDIAGDVHAANIRKAAAAGIAGGYGDGTYRPGQRLHRGQMATFLDRSFDLPDGTPGRFTDVGDGVHRAGILAVERAGIADGYPDGTFRGGNPVTREQLATFLARALDLPPTAPRFADVSGIHAGSVGAVADAGIAEGHPDGTFRPGVAVTRGQMATFLTRALDR